MALRSSDGRKRMLEAAPMLRERVPRFFLVLTLALATSARAQGEPAPTEPAATAAAGEGAAAPSEPAASEPAASEPAASEPAASEPAEKKGTAAQDAVQEPGEEPAAPADAGEEDAAAGAAEGNAKAASGKLALDTDAEASNGDGLGLGLQVHGSAAFTLGAQDHVFPRLVEGDGDPATAEALFFNIPSRMFGGGGVLSYDLSELLSLPGSAVRLGADYLVGSGRATYAQQLAAELAFEKSFQLAKRFEAYVGLGGTASLIALRSIPEYDPVPLRAGGQIPGQKVDMTGMRFGGLAIVGLEFLLLPNLGIRLEGNFRYHLAQQGYDSPNPETAQCPTEPTDPNAPIAEDPSQFPSSLSCWGFDQRKDSWTAAGGRVGMIVLF